MLMLAVPPQAEATSWHITSAKHEINIRGIVNRPRALGVIRWKIEMARTMAVNTMAVMEMLYLFSLRYVHGASPTWLGAPEARAVLVPPGGA
jgi:hypothetical protein